MDRRTFLMAAGKVVVVLPAGAVFLGRCADDDDTTPAPTDTGTTPGDTGTTPEDGGTTPDAGAGELTFQSSLTNAHTHSFTLLVADITTPPASGVSGATSVDDGHSHTVSLTVADLDAIDAGQTVTKETSLDDGHTHTFSFAK